MSHTEIEYQEVIRHCRDLFIKKMEDYGSSWRVLRPISITDQIYIKAQRIRNIQELGKQKIEDHIYDEWVGICNYGIIGMIQLELGSEDEWELSMEKALELYDKNQKETMHLMLRKNHDYGEAWRNMSQESFADLILTKTLRVRQILANSGQTQVSEGILSNFQDMVNYAVFAQIMHKKC